MSDNVKDDRLQQLRGDLAALRARAAAEFGAPDAGPPDAPVPGTAPPADERSGPESVAPIRPADVAPADAPVSTFIEAGHEDGVPPAAGTADHAVAGAVVRSGTRPGQRRRRRPRPPRRSPFRSRTARPPPRLAVPPPISVRRRPQYLVGPRWPVWEFWSGTIVVLVLGLAFLQLALRLWLTINDTAILLGADPTRTDYLNAAAGVAGGGLTLALAVAALAIVRLRWGYLAAAGGVLLIFAVIPYYAYTATAGIVSAPVPVLEQMIRPTQWAYQSLFGTTYWVAVLAVGAATIDLLARAGMALTSGLRR